MKLEWEIIDGYHQRLKVPGGWILKATEDVIHDQGEYGQGMVGGWDFRIAICFVPDTDHKWGE